MPRYAVDDVRLLHQLSAINEQRQQQQAAELRAHRFLSLSPSYYCFSFFGINERQVFFLLHYYNVYVFHIFLKYFYLTKKRRKTPKGSSPGGTAETETTHAG